ncbi:MAG: c-type cytochrome [Verrucomicrobia bacterium]|nr:c-type cytochrome [Verrucomicrobiota bacterium]
MIAMAKKLVLAACLALLVPNVHAGYRLETVTLPAAMSPEVSAVAFSPEGDLYVANRSGDIWTADRTGRNWRRFASGLHEPLGLLVDSARVAYVVHRPELVRLEDTNGDGVVDTFTTINDHWGITGNYHEFAYGLRRDKEGNFVGSLGLDSGGEQEFRYVGLTRGPIVKDKVRNEQQWSLVPYRGWSFKVTPAGEFIPWSYGFRQPSGIGVSPDGEIFSSDNQGDWVASSGLIHHQKDHFYGHPSAMKWLPGGPTPFASAEEMGRARTPPAVILAHGALGGSPGEPVWDLSGGKFGPFGGQIFIGDFSKLVSRIVLEKIDGEYQGAAFPFSRDPALRQGNLRMAFSPDGVLYVGQTSRGWGTGDGLQRFVWDGKPPVEIHSIRLLDRGFALEFTVPLNAADAAKAEKYRVKRFRYYYHEKYGSPRIDEAPVPITSVLVSNGDRRVELTLKEMKPGFVYEFQMESLASASGEFLKNPTGFYTANRLRNGERFTGPFTQPIMAPAEAAEVRGVDVEAGKLVYRTYCVACHQEDGRGGGAVAAAANFVSDRTRLGKSDAELLRTIRTGKLETGMPPFGAVLADQQIQDVLAYVRDAFDPQRARGR